MELAGAGGGGLALWAPTLGALVAAAEGSSRGVKPADGSGLASVGRSPEISTLKKRAAGRMESRINAND